MGQSCVECWALLLVCRLRLRGWGVVDDRHGFLLGLFFFSVIDEREVRTFLHLDPLEVLDFFPQVRSFELGRSEVFLEAFVVVLQFVEEDPRAVFDDELRSRVDVEVRVVRIVEPDLAESRVPGAR